MHMKKKKYVGIVCATYPLKYFRLNWHCLNTFNAKDVECYSTISHTRQLSSSIRCIHISELLRSIIVLWTFYRPVRFFRFLDASLPIIR